MLIQYSAAAPKTVQDIKDFAAHISQTTCPKLAEDLVACLTDEIRTNWHSHCPDADAAWHSFLGKMKEILGDDVTYIIAPMANSPGAAISHLETEIPTCFDMLW